MNAHDNRVAVVRLLHPDGRAVHRLAQAFVDITPVIEVIDDSQLLMPMRGPVRYFGGEDAVVQRIVGVATGVHEGGFGVGVASGRLAAQIAAVRDAPWIISIDAHHRFLADQPVSVLTRFAHVDSDVVSLLERLGLRTLGAVAGVERSLLVDRFGPTGSDIHVLAGGGDLHEPWSEPLPTECFVESHHDDPLEAVDLVVVAASRLVDLVTEQLAPRGLVACRVIAAFTTDHGETCVRAWYHPQGFDAVSLTERLRWQVEKWLDERLTSGVTHASIDVQSTRTRHATQLGLWGGHRESDRAAWSAIARLVSLAGEGVRIPEWRGGRDPMRQFALVPAARVELRDIDSARRRVTPGEVHPEGWTGALAGVVPVVPIEPHRGVDVIDATGTAVVVTGRHLFSAAPATIVDGVRRFRVVQCFGPWPVEERWWDATRRRRVARMQCIVAPCNTDQERALDSVPEQAWLLVIENGTWCVVGTHD